MRADPAPFKAPKKLALELRIMAKRSLCGHENDALIKSNTVAQFLVPPSTDEVVFVLY